MKIIKIEQNTPEWEAERRGRIGGSDTKGILPPSRGTSDAAGFWHKIGERLTSAREDMSESAMDRGHRLENDAITELETIVGLPFNRDAGIWRSEENDMVQLSPDAAEDSDKPTYAAEIKSLSAGKHFKTLYAKQFSALDGIDLVPNEYGSYYREQALEYFVVNPDLDVLFFALYLPEAIKPEHRMVVITIDRESVADEVASQAQTVNEQSMRMKQIINQLIGDDF